MEEAFLARLREDAQDALTRSAYADWLEERGDPRGEYLRQEIALAALAVDAPRFPVVMAWVREREAMNDPRWVADACPPWDVVLLGYEWGQKLTVIHAIRKLTGLGLHDCKKLTDSVPSRVVRGVSFRDAWRAAAKLREVAGAWPAPVRIEASNGDRAGE